MRRVLSIVPAVLAVVGALVLVLGRPNTALSVKPNCQDRILQGGTSASYNCDVTDEFGNTGSMTLDFSKPSVGNTEDLDVVINGSVAGTCACTKKGKDLEKGKRFRCAMDNVSIGDNTSVGDFGIQGSTIEGRPNKKGTKIQQGQGEDNDGDSILYSCEEAPL
jgi:hypothetical protein